MNVFTKIKQDISDYNEAAEKGEVIKVFGPNEEGRIPEGCWRYCAVYNNNTYWGEMFGITGYYD